MKTKTSAIQKHKYTHLKQNRGLDKELSEDIIHGVKDIIYGRVKKI